MRTGRLCATREDEFGWHGAVEWTSSGVSGRSSKSMKEDFSLIYALQSTDERKQLGYLHTSSNFFAQEAV